MEQFISSAKTKLQTAIQSQHGDEGTLDLLEYLDQIFRDNIDDVVFLEDVCNMCIDNGMLEHLVGVWKKLMKPELYQDLEQKNGKVLQKLKEVIWNYSDRCPDLCRAIHYNAHIVGLLLDELKHFALKLAELENDLTRHHIKADFGILHNLLRHYDDIKYQIRSNRGLDIVVCYTRSEYLIIQTYGYAILAFCTESNEINMLLPGMKVFKFLLELLEDTLEVSNHVLETYGLSIEEVVQCLSKLAGSDENKKAIVDSGFLIPVTQMLNAKSFSMDEIFRSLELFWTLSLHEYSKKALRAQSDLVKKVDEINSNPKAPPKVKKECSSLLFTLKPHAEQPDRHVMLSYQWDSQEAIKKLYEYLNGENFPVWMDIHSLKGSIYCSMAEAVENASVIVMAVTRKYKESENCKKEAEYACVRGIPVLPLMLDPDYKPDGWLGLMLGAKLYVTVAPENPSRKFSEIRKQLLTFSNP